MLTQVAQMEGVLLTPAEDGGKGIAEERFRGRGQQDLAPMPHRHEPRSTVDRASEIISGTEFGGSCMEPHPYTQCRYLGPLLRKQGKLATQGCCQGSGGGSKRSVKAIARRLDYIATLRLDHLSQYLIVPGRYLLHRAGVMLPEGATPFNVGE
jgi:hypothetical protein